jgi:lipoate-protein ligase A
MSDPGRCRLLRHAPAGGAWNMAVDETLLDRAQDLAAPWFRFYQWGEPTLSLGYFQNYTDRAEHAPSLACPAVRRLSGGGAILHDVELTYSIGLPRVHPLAARRDELYNAVHGCLIEALKRFGVTARLCGRIAEAETRRRPFLCFQRRSPGDVLIGESKICGSAQRRRNGAVLQHGSLVWRRSFAAPEVAGVADAADHPLELEIVAQRWLDCLGRSLGFDWQPDELGDKERIHAKMVEETRYACGDWTKNRDRRTVHCQETL